MRAIFENYQKTAGYHVQQVQVSRTAHRGRDRPNGRTRSTFD